MRWREMGRGRVDRVLLGAVLLCACRLAACAAAATGAEGASGGSRVVPANLLDNPSFERVVVRGDGRTVVSGWQMFQIDFDHVPSPRFGRNGGSSFVMRHTVDAAYPWKGVGQHVALEHGNASLALRLSCYVSGFKLAEPAAVSMDVEYQDGTYRMDVSSFSPKGTFSWTKVSASLPGSKPVKWVSCVRGCRAARLTRAAPQERDGVPDVQGPTGADVRCVL